VLAPGTRDGQREAPKHHQQFCLERPLPGGDTDALRGHAHACAHRTLSAAHQHGRLTAPRLPGGTRGQEVTLLALTAIRDARYAQSLAGIC